MPSAIDEDFPYFKRTTISYIFLLSCKSPGTCFINGRVEQNACTELVIKTFCLLTGTTMMNDKGLE